MSHRLSPIGMTVFFVLTIVSVCFIVLSACSRDKTEDEGLNTTREAVKIVYVDWASEKASANVVKAVIEDRLGRDCQLMPVSLIAMWESLAAGDQDAMVAGWMPSLQKRFYDKFKSEVDYLGHNMEGTSIGLVTPDYVSIESIPELKNHAEKFDNKIIGIDPHAGIMEKTDLAIQEYGLDNFELVSGSGPTMTTVLGKAIKEKRWIVVTGWTPHWKFAKWDLKYLKDPRKVFGEAEYIDTVARKGLKEDMPEVYAFLDRFHWKPEDMARVMLWAQGDETTYLQAARRWIRENPGLVDTWVGEENREQ